MKPPTKIAVILAGMLELALSPACLVPTSTAPAAPQRGLAPQPQSVAPAPSQNEPATWQQRAAPGERHLQFNGHDATERDLQIIAELERISGHRLPDGAYWYDTASGAAGRWGGPTETVIPAGLGLGGALPPNASGGGTGVFINHREIHPIDLAGLQQLVGGPVAPGRYWVDAQGNAGLEGGPPVINLASAARQRSGRNGKGWIIRDSTGPGGMSVAGDGSTTCVNTSERTICTDGNN